MPPTSPTRTLQKCSTIMRSVASGLVLMSSRTIWYASVIKYSAGVCAEVISEKKFPCEVRKSQVNLFDFRPSCIICFASGGRYDVFTLTVPRNINILFLQIIGGGMKFGASDIE
jgi:hypothetical protein